jgi:hypothetical protein
MWPVYNLVSLIITDWLVHDIYLYSFEFVMHGANECYPDSCKWIALLQLNDLLLFLHMFIVHRCGILINFYSRIMLIGLNMRIKVIHFLVPLSQRGDLYLQSGSRRRYIIHLISLSSLDHSLYLVSIFFKGGLLGSWISYYWILLRSLYWFI